MLKYFIIPIKEYRKPALLTAVFMLAAVLLEVTVPFLMVGIVDYGITPGDMEATWRRGGVLIGASLTSLTFGLFSGIFLAKSSAGFAKSLRNHMYSQINEFSFKNLDKLTTGALVTRLTTDVTALQTAFSSILRICTRSPFMLTFSLIMAFYINSSLAWIFVLVVPVLGMAMYFIIRTAFPLYKLALKKYDELNVLVQENFKAIKIVKSFVREDYEKAKFGEASKDIQDIFTKTLKIVALFNPITQFAIYVCMILIAWFGAGLLVVEDMTMGELMSFIIYINQILFSMIMIGMLFVTIAMSRASAERIAEIFSEIPDMKIPDNPGEIVDGRIDFENVSFGYTDKYVLENVNLSINHGETVGILGGTGSSKTTLVQLIPRLYDVSQGVLKVGGVNVKDLDLTALRDKISIVLQKNTLFEGTVSQNLRWAGDVSDDEIINACKMAKAHDFIMAMGGYETHIEQGGTNLSGGQRQRLCIARAILKKPYIIIFDDSTSSVDTTTENFILNSIKEMVKGTKLIISQRISSVQFADKIILMDNKQILAQGTHSELMTNKVYQEIYDSQTKNY